MVARRNFRGGGGCKLNKAVPHKDKKGPSHGEKSFDEVKKVAKIARKNLFDFPC